MEDIILISEKIKQYPSLYQAFMANKEAVEEIDNEKIMLGEESEEINKKYSLAKELNLPTRRLKANLNKIQKTIRNYDKMKVAYTNGYLEIPELQTFNQVVEIREGESHSWWQFRPDSRTPLRVFEAIKKAKDMKIFDNLVVFQKPHKRDPIIAGKINDRYFYITSWR